MVRQGQGTRLIELLLPVYGAGVAMALWRTDARWPARIALALVWPLGLIAFAVTIAILMFASLIAFPILGAIVLALGLALVALAGSGAAQTPALEARFIGNMALAISDGRLTLISDFPYESGYGGYMTYDAGEIRSPTPETVALVTHRHRDHWEPRLFAATTWRVIAPDDALTGIAPERVVRALRVKPVRATLSIGGATVEALPTPHAGIGHYSYLVSWHGRRLYFTGDTESLDQLLTMKDLDVAFVSPWLYERARKGGQRIDARRVVIYHHTAAASIQSCRDACRVPAQGEILRF